jgi:hypothetical protein
VLVVEHAIWYRNTVRGVFLIAILLGACGDAAGPASVGPDPAAPLPQRCQALDDQIREAVATPGSCNTTADCEIIGGQLDQPTCNCAPSVLDCTGHPIESNAPGLARAKQLISDFKAQGCPQYFKPCDCAPRGRMICRDDHTCDAPWQSCAPPPPETADDAAAGDASSDGGSP